MVQGRENRIDFTSRLEVGWGQEQKREGQGLGVWV